jgi:rare lipoprotein A (peptidoglycan hydrolase)
LRATNAELSAVRDDLNRRVAADDARRAEEERKADEARRRANAQRAAEQASARAAGEGSLLPRHKAATARQVELMGKYPFGPLATGAGIPAGLRDTGGRVSGKASWYGPGFHGRATASGAIYDQEGWTTASRDLPLGTLLIVSRGDKRLLLLVNDRGPYVYDRVLDLSHAAATYLGVGVTPVEAMVVAPS